MNIKWVRVPDPYFPEHREWEVREDGNTVARVYANGSRTSGWAWRVAGVDGGEAYSARAAKDRAEEALAKR